MHTALGGERLGILGHGQPCRMEAEASQKVVLGDLGPIWGGRCFWKLVHGMPFGHLLGGTGDGKDLVWLHAELPGFQPSGSPRKPSPHSRSQAGLYFWLESASLVVSEVDTGPRSSLCPRISRSEGEQTLSN